MDDYTRPDPERAALLTIDVQNDFSRSGAPAEIAGTAEALPLMRRVVEAFRAAGAPVVHVVRLYRADGSNVDRCRKGAIEAGDEVVRPGSEGAELVDELRPATADGLDADRLLAGEVQELGSREWAMYKPRWSAFHRTPLDGFLSERGVNTVVVCGCNFPNCPRTTVYGASQRDYRILFVADATSRTDDRGVAELEDIGVAVEPAEQVVEWISSRPPADQ